MNVENQSQMAQQQQVPSESLPQSMRFGIGSRRAARARLSLLNLQPYNGNSFSADSNNEVRINLQSSGFMDVAKHSLRMTVSVVTTTATANIDYSLASLFDQVRLESSGTVLERLDRYSLIDNAKSMYNDSMTELKNKSCTSLGPDFTATNMLSAGADFGGTTSGSLTGSLRIRSGLLQSKHGHALPMGSAPIELVLRMNPKAACVLGKATSGITSVTVSNVSFLCPMYQIESEQIMAQYRQVLQSSPITICGETYKTYVNSLVASGTNQVLQINDRSRSLKALCSVIRTNAAASTYIFPSNSEFLVTNVNRYTYNIAGSQMPPGGVNLSDGVGEAVDQAQKALTPYNQIRGSGLVGLAKFNAATAAAGTGGKGVLCVDLKKFSDSERCFVGIDTASNAQPMTVEFECAAGITASDVTTFAICEAEYVLQGGRWGVSV